VVVMVSSVVSPAGQHRPTSYDGHQHRRATRPELIAAGGALGRAGTDHVGPTSSQTRSQRCSGSRARRLPTGRAWRSLLCSSEGDTLRGMRTIALRLRPGADLKAELLALAARERVQAGWVLTCVGSLSQVRVRLAGGTEHGTWQGAFEIVALTGTLSRDGGHLHLAVADHQGRTVGGHLAEGCTVRTTAEVVLAADDRLVFAREHDPATGYDELVVRERDL
jgi:uncharacterized protein